MSGSCPFRKQATAIILKLKSIFSRHGIPMSVTSDNVPFNSESCGRFAAEWGFQWLFNSPGNPQSNGMVERHIQAIKNVLRKATLVVIVSRNIIKYIDGLVPI